MISFKNTINLTDARKDIFDIAEKVRKTKQPYTFTREGRPEVVLMAAEEYESMVETMEVMRDFPDILKRSQQVSRAIKKGDYRGFISLDALKKKYEIRSAGIKRRSKSNR